MLEPNARRITIACLIHSLDGGGAERVMAGLSSRLAEKGHQVSLITLDDGSTDRHQCSATVKRHPLKVMADSSGWWSAATNTISRMRSIRRSLDEIRPDVLLSFCDRTNILAVLSAGHLAGLSVGILPGTSRGKRLPLVLSERSDPAKQVLPKPWRWLRKRTYRRATTVICQTAAAARWLAELGIASRVVPSAVDVPPSALVSQTADGTVRDKDSTDRRLIVTVGRLSHEKGMDRLINAFAKIASRSPNWDLRIVGDGPCRKSLQSQIESSSLQVRVALAGWKSPVWSELQSADLFVLPSRYEGFPSALLEAMAVGLPVIALDSQEGSMEVIRPQVDGVIAADDVDSLAEAMARLTMDADLRAHLGANAKSVLERFGWESMVDQYEAVLVQAIESDFAS